MREWWRPCRGSLHDRADSGAWQPMQEFPEKSVAMGYGFITRVFLRFPALLGN